MQRAMLADEYAAIDADDLAVGEGFAEYLGSPLVILRLVVGGIEHGTIDDEEVGIGGGQTLIAFFGHCIGEIRFEDRSGKGEG